MLPHPPSGFSYIFRFPPFSFASGSSDVALSYSQPPATELLVLLSFLFLLNVAKVVADYVLHAGIIAEIVLGAVYGSPLGAILPQSWEVSFTAMGYLGLIGLVFEGGLSTNLQVLMPNLALSLACAALGVALPIALSFALLQAGFGCRPVEAFAAGAALASTSLGTTLMALKSVSPAESNGFDQNNDILSNGDNKVTSNTKSATHDHIEPNISVGRTLQESRIGTVLISAAVIDDVIGLVLASIIPALSTIGGQSEDSTRSTLPWKIIRPILSSVLIALISVILSRFVLRPLFWFRGIGERWCAPRRPGKPWGFEGMIRGRSSGRWGTRSHADAVQLTLTVLTVSAFSAIAFYTGSSVLFGAYVAGLTLSYISQPYGNPGCPNDQEELTAKALSFEEMYGRTIGPLQDHILAPLFFASIGFSIPFRALWRPAILWRGALYSVLMCIAKLATGIPILCWSIWKTPRHTRYPTPPIQNHGIPQSVTHTNASWNPNVVDSIEMTQINSLRADNLPPQNFESEIASYTPSLLSHIIPACFLGIAMVSRGEIGLLVAQIAHDPESSLLEDDTYIIAIWAILLCTLIGPIGTGVVVKRWNKWLQTNTWR